MSPTQSNVSHPARTASAGLGCSERRRTNSVAWFGTQASIDLRPGGEVVFTWDVRLATCTSLGVIETVEPTQRLLSVASRPGRRTDDPRRVHARAARGGHTSVCR